MGLLAALDLLIPPACAGCGLPGDAACAACLATLRDLPPPWCGGCGGPVAVPVDRCPECRGPLSGARQAVRYAGAAPALVAALKDGRRRTLAEVLAAETAARVAAPPVGVALVPVPLGPRRLRERGFNQSLLLARALGGGGGDRWPMRWCASPSAATSAAPRRRRGRARWRRRSRRRPGGGRRRTRGWWTTCARPARRSRPAPAPCARAAPARWGRSASRGSSRVRIAGRPLGPSRLRR